MDGILQIGPFALAADRLLPVAAIWAFVAIAGLIATRWDGRAARASGIALVVGVIAARIGYILANLDAFLVEPWSMLAVWQGGFAVAIGLAAAAITILATLGRTRAGGAMLVTLAGLALLHAGATTLLAPEKRSMPSLALADLAGNKVDLSEPGQPMVINLWATWCPPCRREMPMLIDVASHSEVPVLLVNQGEDSSTIRAFLAEQQLSDDAVLTDPSGTLGRAVASPALPTTLFVSAAGEIVDVHAGEISRAALAAAIRDLQRTR